MFSSFHHRHHHHHHHHHPNEAPTQLAHHGPSARRVVSELYPKGCRERCFSSGGSFYFHLHIRDETRTSPSDPCANKPHIPSSSGVEPSPALLLFSVSRMAPRRHLCLRWQLTSLYVFCNYFSSFLWNIEIHQQVNSDMSRRESK